MTDPSTDPVGTVRREEHEGGYSIWQRHQPDATRGNEWTCVWSTARGNIECTAPHPAVADFPVIGAVPGTPAAEPDAADDEVAVERIARTLHRGAWERDIANGTPLEGNDVDVCWSKVGAKYREWYYADARAALAALRGDQS